MKKFFTVFVSIFALVWYASAQITFDQLDVETWYGNGENEVMFVVDFDPDPIGADSAFAWGINFNSDSISGVEIMNLIAQLDDDFTFDTGGGFLNNISYISNSQTYTNPNAGWFSILEASDGTNWAWNNGIGDNVGDGRWFGIVVMDPDTWEAEINVPLLPVGVDNYQSDYVELKAFPNPATESLYIDLSEYSEIVMMSISGQIVHHQSGKNMVIDLTNVPSGMYAVKIIGREISLSKKIIVQ